MMSLGGSTGSLLPFTADKQRIHDTLAAIRVGGTMPRSDPHDSEIVRYAHATAASTNDKDAMQKERDFLDSFDALQGALKARTITLAVGQLADALAAAPGKKVILLVTTGCPSGSLPT